MRVRKAFRSHGDVCGFPGVPLRLVARLIGTYSLKDASQIIMKLSLISWTSDLGWLCETKILPHHLWLFCLWHFRERTIYLHCIYPGKTTVKPSKWFAIKKEPVWPLSFQIYLVKVCWFLLRCQRHEDYPKKIFGFFSDDVVLGSRIFLSNIFPLNAIFSLFVSHTFT